MLPASDLIQSVPVNQFRMVDFGWLRDEGIPPMATMVTGADLVRAVREQTFIKGGDITCAEGVKYDFRLSPRILKAKFGAAVDANKLGEVDRRELRVDPGEVVFVLTEERLELPGNVVAQLSPKRKMSHAGILTLGGFCVDPGYKGRLLVGLFNFSSTPFTLIPGKKLIAATFFQLAASEAADLPVPTESFEDFPEELIQVMQKYQPLPVQAAMQHLEDDLSALRKEVQSHQSWYDRFKEMLTAHNDQIGRLAKDLEQERDVRRSGQDELTKAVHGIEQTLSILKGGTKVLIWILGIATAAFLAWLARMAEWV